MDIEYLYLNSDHSWFFHDFYLNFKAMCILSDATCEKMHCNGTRKNLVRMLRWNGLSGF